MSEPQIPTAARVAIILAFSLIGIAGSYSVAAFGIRINTFANSRTAMASLAAEEAGHLELVVKALHARGRLTA